MDAGVDGEEADRPTAEDEDGVALLDAVEPQRGDRGRERLDQDRDARVEPSGTATSASSRTDDPVGEDPRAVEAQQAAVLAEVLLAAAAGRAATADDEREDGVATAAACDRPDRLVAEDERRPARAGMPAVGVEVGAADARDLHVEDDLALARLRVGKLVELEDVVARARRVRASGPSGKEASVDGERRAGREGGRVGREPDDGLGDLLGQSRARQGMLADERLPLLRIRDHSRSSPRRSRPVRGSWRGRRATRTRRRSCV